MTKYVFTVSPDTTVQELVGLFDPLGNIMRQNDGLILKIGRAHV